MRREFLNARAAGSALIVAGGLLVSAGAADAQNEAIAERGSFHVLRKRDRALLCQSSWQLERTGSESLFLERGLGTCHGFPQPVRWESTTRFVTDDPGQLRECSRTIVTADGATLLKATSRQYDPATKTLAVRVVQPGQPDRVRMRGGLDRAATPSSLLFVIRDALARGEQSGTVELATSEPSFYTIRWIARGRERVTGPTGTHLCLKVELQADLGILGWLRPWFPRLFMWYTDSPPHHWIKYEGLEDGLRSARVVIERTSPIP